MSGQVSSALTAKFIHDISQHYEAQIADLTVEVERLRAEVGEWRSAACINPERNWPHFEEWDKSQLARCFMKYVGGPREDWADHVKAYAALQPKEDAA
jgi:hypothetical protein